MDNRPLALGSMQRWTWHLPAAVGDRWRYLWPNQLHGVRWGPVFAARAAYHAECIAAIRAQSGPDLPRFAPPARLRIEWRYPTRQRRDLDGLYTAFKPGQDCLVQAGILDDDAATMLPEVTLAYTVTPGSPRIVLTIEGTVVGVAVPKPPREPRPKPAAVAPQAGQKRPSPPRTHTTAPAPKRTAVASLRGSEGRRRNPSGVPPLPSGRLAHTAPGFLGPRQRPLPVTQPTVNRLPAGPITITRAGTRRPR